MSAQKIIIGKNAASVAEYPAICLINPKYKANVGAIQRAASCFGAKQIWYTGNRIALAEGERMPREERMKGYRDVTLVQNDYPFDQFKGEGVVPVAIELLPNSECLYDFEHPEKAVYVFGPEDGSIDSVSRRHCHRFLSIPMKHCANLAAAVYMVLYDRMFKHYQLTGEKIDLAEERGWVEHQNNEDIWSDHKHGVAFL